MVSGSTLHPLPTTELEFLLPEPELRVKSGLLTRRTPLHPVCSQVTSAAGPPHRCTPQEAAVKFMNPRQNFAHLFNIVSDKRTALLKYDALFLFLFYCF